MTFDMVMILMGLPYDRFDCLLFWAGFFQGLPPRSCPTTECQKKLYVHGLMADRDITLYVLIKKYIQYILYIMLCCQASRSHGQENILKGQHQMRMKVLILLPNPYYVLQ